MEQKPKLYYIRGHKTRFSEVRVALQNANPDAKTVHWKMSDPNLLYYIDSLGAFCYTVDGDNLTANLLKAYGEELHLKRFPDEEDDSKEDWLKGKERCVFVKESGDFFMYLPHDAPKEERLFPRGSLNVVHLLSPADLYLDLRRKSDTADMDVSTLELAPASAIEDWNDLFLHPNHLHYSQKDRCMRRWFNPFDKVLVRNFDDQEWRCDVFSHYEPCETSPFPLEEFKCVGSAWSQCLLFTEVSEQLLGTYNDPTPNQL